MTLAPRGYAAQVLHLKANAMNSGLMACFPGRGPLPVHMLAALMADHKKRVDQAARELGHSPDPKAAAAKRAQQMRRLDYACATLIPSTLKA